MKDVCFYLDEVTRRFTADDVDLSVYDGHNFSQRKTDVRETDTHTHTHTNMWLPK